MTVTCTLLDTTDGTKNLTIGSVDGTKVTAVTNGSSPPTRSVNGSDFDKGVQNVNTVVGLTISAFLAMQAIVKDPVTPSNTITVASHPTDSTLVLVTIGSDLRTLNAQELRDAIANCLRTL